LAVDIQDTSTISHELWVHAEEEGRIIFNIFYYPGWRAYVLTGADGEIDRELAVLPHGSLGRVSVWVPVGEYHLLLRFENTTVRTVGEWLSLLSLSAVFAVLAFQEYQRRKTRG